MITAPVKVVRTYLLWAGIVAVSMAALNSVFAQESTAADPSDANAIFEQGLVALKENRFDAALEKLTAAEHERPGDPKIRNFRGITLAAMGRSSEASSEYREAIRLAPQMADPYRNLGFLEWTRHELDSARTNLTRAVQLSPEDSFAHYYLGRVELDAERFREAFDQLTRSNVPWPDDAGFLLQIGAGYIATGRESEAGKTLDKVSQLRLAEAQAAQLAYLRVQLHQADAAIKVLRSLASAQEPVQPWTVFDTALVQIMSGNYLEAITQAQSYMAALPADPSDRAEAWCLVGIASARAGHPQQSIDAFQNAAKLAPLQEENWLNLTRELMELNRYSDSITTLQEALASNPNSYALHLRLGAAYLAAGQHKEAETAFRELVSAGDPLPTSYVGLAQVQLRTGRPEEAVLQLSAAEKKLGPTFLISYFLGLAFERAGKPTEALAGFEKATQLKPDSADAHIGAGKVQLSLGHIHEAIQELESGLRINPKNVRARRLLSAAYRRAGDPQIAAKYAQSVATSEQPAAGDLVGDFFLPSWKYPPAGPKR
jgi:tetratricopeptide (TPR) repeat protein